MLQRSINTSALVLSLVVAPNVALAQPAGGDDPPGVVEVPLPADPAEPGETDGPEPPETDPSETDPSEPDGVQDDRGALGQGDRAAAESLQRVGKGLMDLGQYEEACPKLEQSMEASPQGGTAMMLGECREKQGKVASAWAAYRQATTQYKRSGDELVHEAQKRAQRLEALVPKLTINAAKRVTGMRVFRGDTRFGEGVIGVPLAVDPGPVIIRVEADGFETWTKQVDVKASERLTVTVPELEPAEAKAVATSGGDSGPGALFYAGVITAGVGVAGIAVGTILGVSASRDVSNAQSDEALCGQARACTPAGRDLISTADTKAVGSTIAFTISGIAIATGLILVIVDSTSRHGDGGDGVTAAIAPLVLPEGGGFTAHVRF